MNKGVKYIVFILLGLVMFANSAFAQSTPLDTVVVWFNDSLNQEKQVGAFYTIIVQEDYHRSTDMVEVSPEYDSTRVRNAFENFVRSITINAYTSYPPGFKASLSLNNRPAPEDSVGLQEAEEWDVPHILDYVLSLYVNWGFTTDLYTIADLLYQPHVNRIGYYAIIWNELGMDYFEHLEDEQESDSTFYKGIWICSEYLTQAYIKEDDLEEKALDLLADRTLSGVSSVQRMYAGARMVEIYMKGYTNVKACIDTLLQADDQYVKREVIWDIQEQQRKNNLLMEFDLGSDE